LEVVADVDDPDSHPCGVDDCVVFGPGADMADGFTCMGFCQVLSGGGRNGKMRSERSLSRRDLKTRGPDTGRPKDPSQRWREEAGYER
jgi:hypothetical protein